MATATVAGSLPARLIAAGIMDPITGATRSARARICPSCGRTVIRGINSPFGGWSVDCEWSPLSALGELLALLNGITTYTLTYIGGRAEIDTRDHFRIRGAPAGSGRFDVLPAHRCDLLALPGCPSRLADPPRPEPGDDPPY